MQGTQTLAHQTPGNGTLGHYRILREAGRGGMSMVYEAEDTRIGRRVALKVLSAPLSLPPEQRDAMIARLKREARAIARLSHPNIVTIFDIGEDGGQHFIVMEFLEGLTLRERLSEGPLPLEDVSAILDQVASGLDAVHAAGIVHRDIKPSNVMLLPGGLVKLMDFGVARQHEDTLVTQAGSIVGSPTYMAPEQTEGETSTTASDLWSLGVTLYEMLAGRAPFVGESVPRILYQVAHERPPVPAGVTTAVRDVLNRALEKKPARRYATAGQLAKAFRAALPKPAGPVYPPRARPLLDRRPIAGAAGLLLLVLLAALPSALHPRRTPATLGQPMHQVVVPQAKAKPKPVSVTSSPTHPLATIAAPTVRVASWQQTRRFRHPKRAQHRAALLPDAARGAAVPLAPTRPRHVRHRAALTAYRPAPPRPQQDQHSETPGVFPSAPSASSRVTPQPASGSEPNLLGTWHGILTNHRATIHFDHRQGNDYTGTMSVHTGGYDAHVAVTGHVSPRTGTLSMRETRRLPGTTANAWDLGTETGRIGGDGRISGTGTDPKHHTGTWSFSH